MNVYRKSLIVQLLMFIVFIIMGVNVIVQYYIGQSFPVYNFFSLRVISLVWYWWVSYLQKSI